MKTLKKIFPASVILLLLIIISGCSNLFSDAAVHIKIENNCASDIIISDVNFISQTELPVTVTAKSSEIIRGDNRPDGIEFKIKYYNEAHSFSTDFISDFNYNLIFKFELNSAGEIIGKVYSKVNTFKYELKKIN